MAMILFRSLLTVAIASTAMSVFGSSTSFTVNAFQADVTAPYTFSMPRLDPSLGTLTSVDAILTSSAVDVYTVTNSSAQPMTSPSGAVFSFAIGNGTTTPFGGAAQMIGDPLVAQPGQTYNFSRSATVGNSWHFETLADLAPFSGVGPATWSIDSQLIVVGADNMPSFDQTHTVRTLDHSLQLTYNYAPVPEPATVATLALGAASLLRRRRKTAA